MDQDIELRHMRYFVAVAEELHFGRAANKLHLAQPALSQQIRRLEEILGVSLFYRTSRSVVLTAAGEVFLERARRTLRNVRLDAEEARGVGLGQIGHLNIGFVGSTILSTMPAICNHYRRANPLVQMHLHESFTSRVVAGLLDGSLDAGVIRDSDPQPEMEIKRLFEERYVAVLPRTHPRAAQKSLLATSLKDEAFVFYPRSAGCVAFDKPLALVGGAGFRPRVVQEASHWLSIVRLIAAGFGVSIAPACVSSLRDEGVVYVPLRDAGVVSTVELAYRKGEQRSIVHGFAAMATSTRAKTVRR